MADERSIAAFAAAQHGPRPLTLFLDMLRSETAANPVLRGRALQGLAAYQRAPRDASPCLAPIAARVGRAILRDHGGTGRPVVLVPSLINPPSILDLAPDRSLVAFLRDREWRPLMIDWGAPTRDEAGLDLAGHVEQLLLPLIAAIDEPAPLIGYCLGGTLALAAAALGSARALATIAAPWHFAGYGDTTRRDMAALWAGAEPAARALGVVPMEVLQAAFWRLDPARTIAKFADFGDQPPDSAAVRDFVRLEDWANSGAPLPYAAGRDLFEMLLRDDAPGHGAWQVGGRRVDPAALRCPAIEFLSSTDRIAPASTAAGLPDQRIVDAGHVGMMVGSRAGAQLWQPLAGWLDGLPD